MKRTREYTIAVQYPKILFIVDDHREVGQTIKTLLFQPYLGDECNRLLERLLNEEGEDDTIRRIFISLLYGMTNDEDHMILSQVCLTDTKKNVVGCLETIGMKDMWQMGPTQVEYISIGNPTQIPEKEVLLLTTEEEKTLPLEVPKTEILESTPIGSPIPPQYETEIDNYTYPPHRSVDRYVPSHVIPLAGDNRSRSSPESHNKWGRDPRQYRSNNNDGKPNERTTEIFERHYDKKPYNGRK